ncbi:MAG: flagellar motor protein MotD [Steroidobacteraceae bacterium]
MYRRKKRHKAEDHGNHEAWAIPYGDLVTLLLAFFVVMYAISSVNEGKYQVLSDSLAAAFRGQPRTFDPIEMADKSGSDGGAEPLTVLQQALQDQLPRSVLQGSPLADDKAAAEIRRMAELVETALGPLIDKDLITVRRTAYGVEVEMRADILFSSGSAELSPTAAPVLNQVAATLRPMPNAIRVEGHTDNVPLRGRSAYPSNWELSAARAASVVHLFTDQGMPPKRLSVAAFGEQRPAQTNDTPEGRNANRRVLVVVLGEESAAAAGVGTEPAPVPATQ